MVLRYAVTASADYAYSRDSRRIMKATLSLPPRTVTSLPFLVSAAVTFLLHLGIACWNAVYSLDLKLTVLRDVNLVFRSGPHFRRRCSGLSCFNTLRSLLVGGAPLIDTFGPLLYTRPVSGPSGAFTRKWANSTL
jgi:hypothetical protein